MNETDGFPSVQVVITAELEQKDITVCHRLSPGDIPLWWGDESILSDRVQDGKMVSHLKNPSINCYMVDILPKETIIATTGAELS